MIWMSYLSLCKAASCWLTCSYIFNKGVSICVMRFYKSVLFVCLSVTNSCFTFSSALSKHFCVYSCKSCSMVLSADSLKLLSSSLNYSLIKLSFVFSFLGIAGVDLLLISVSNFPCSKMRTRYSIWFTLSINCLVSAYSCF